MEAKDTVMDEKKRKWVLRSLKVGKPTEYDMQFNSGYEAIAQAQAEISFKLGIKEVVEWTEATFNMGSEWREQKKKWGL